MPPYMLVIFWNQDNLSKRVPKEKVLLHSNQSKNIDFSGF
jgi:hypothetical protein